MVSSQMTNRLHPELIEAGLIFPESPAPCLVEAEKNAPARPETLLHGKRVASIAIAGGPAAVGIGAGPARMDEQYFGRRLDAIVVRPPVHGCQLLPDRAILCLIRIETEDGVKTPRRRQLWPIRRSAPGF